MLRLFCAPRSTNVERVALALAYKGLEAERVWIDYADRSPVVAVSGQPLVPVLAHDHVVVAGSLRIVRHLERAFGAADCAAFPFLKYARGAHPDEDEPFHAVLAREPALDGGFPRLAAWIARVDARPRA